MLPERRHGAIAIRNRRRIEGFAKAEARVLVKKAELLAREAELLHGSSVGTGPDASST